MAEDISSGTKPFPVNNDEAAKHAAVHDPDQAVANGEKPAAAAPAQEQPKVAEPAKADAAPAQEQPKVETPVAKPTFHIAKGAPGDRPAYRSPASRPIPANE